ncbi:MAG: glutamate--tRNA ligase [Pseudomonadota bacterium]
MPETPSSPPGARSASVVTRFAPSPTGYLHIGGARTALFNWLFARHHGGKFLLRIEDTDRSRHNEDAVAAIIDGLAWLGLDADAPPISQFENRARHCAVAHELLASGHAYRCYLSAEEIAALREKARAKDTRFESPWRDMPSDKYPDGQPFTVRFKAPRHGETIIEDAVQGQVTFPNQALDDLILLRSGAGQDAGEPTYNLAVVVDDHDMGISHVIRGDDHLINAARQSQIYDALGWTRPVFAHIPLIFGPDGKKLSKRHGALGVEAYRDQGYVAPGLANYLLRLGWAHGDEEIIERNGAIDLFSLDGINKAPARLDFDKLAHVNAHYLIALSDDDFLAAANPFLNDQLKDEKEALRRAVPYLKSRCATLADINEAAAFIAPERPITLSGKKAKPLRKEGTRNTLMALQAHLGGNADWRVADNLTESLEAFAQANELGFGQFGPPLRALLTAGHPSPDLGVVLFILGRGEALSRLATGLETQEIN